MKIQSIATSLLLSGLLLFGPTTLLAGDADGDTWEDEYDNCVDVPNEDQKNYDVDEQGDACDTDDDNDDIHDSIDLYPFDSSR